MESKATTKMNKTKEKLKETKRKTTISFESKRVYYFIESNRRKNGMCIQCTVLCTVANSAKKNRKRTINAIENAQIANFIVLAHIPMVDCAIVFALESLLC